MTAEEAHKIIDEVYPKPNSNPEYINPEIDENLDLSVIIPVYNYADILEDNIKSILNQKTTYNYEVIFVDDGSTDGAGDILKKYENHPGVKLIFQKNGGIGAARNTGINNANGRYIMFIDCDDTVHDNIIEVLMSEAYAKDCDMVMAAHNLVKERNNQVYAVIPNIYPQRNLSGYKNGDSIMNYAGLPWGKVYKRELWNDVRFFPGYWYEDTIIIFLLFSQCKKFSYIPEVIYEYKWYENNFSHTQTGSKNLKAIDFYWLLREILTQYEKMGLERNNALYTLVLRHISSYYYSKVSNMDDKVLTALFVLAKELYLDYKPKEKVRLPYMLRQIEKAFDRNDIELWKLASSYL
ncbi:MAG: glycosyltransferase family 2 protein [Ruminococcus sp.]